MIQSLFYNDNLKIRILMSLVLFFVLFLIYYSILLHVYASSDQSIIIKDNITIHDNIKASVIKASSDHTSIHDNIKASVIRP